ncbi:MAG: RNA methyltransferase [Candidatus Lloydbacteria bacterium CG22_combo_CG10-13_8_21_14_all_47_15]|uniref:RNA methyltransferase n=1 Tax=Candidatus Lloydbacteria bacterium CG22_combo_CG10-13_8_21_14_all_47_15 TaxID=1974635 RepID=A0A2H0CU75_9BACT|nr:MAG: RNA methyltransferase [Candidatus Lloydbacteria bacterium CG22_combo_CG10-13_8_21_14_all_47_15]
MSKKEAEIVLILHNLRSVENVGSIFRTADAAGVSKIYCAGYTPAPIDRFGRKRRDITKSALGAEEFILWEQIGNTNEAIISLKNKGFFIVGVEQDKHSVDYRHIPKAQKIAFIFGNEVEGIPSGILTNCDKIAEIPMRGKKESLNVAVSAGIILFRAVDE